VLDGLNRLCKSLPDQSDRYQMFVRGVTDTVIQTLFEALLPGGNSRDIHDAELKFRTALQMLTRDEANKGTARTPEEQLHNLRGEFDLRHWSGREQTLLAEEIMAKRPNCSISSVGMASVTLRLANGDHCVVERLALRDFKPVNLPQGAWEREMPSEKQLARWKAEEEQQERHEDRVDQFAAEDDGNTKFEFGARGRSF
jgi:hypothetical protein